MNLNDLGFDDWFAERAAASLPPGHGLARVTAVDRGAWLVRNERGEVHAEVTGKLRFSVESQADLPSVGDWVGVQYHNSGTAAVIHEVLPRKTFLRRKCAGKAVDIQIVAANIDVAFIVLSCHFDFNIRRLDRYLVMAHEGRIEPRVVLTKIDLIGPEVLAQRMAEIRQAGMGAASLALSNTTGVGVDEFRRQLVPGKTCCLLGSSGVGKTTLINRMVCRDAFETKPVSGTGEGRHATARRQLVVLDGGAMLIDTPGMRELGLLADGDGLDESFAEIRELATACRFADCTHTEEPGCGVLRAVASGELSEERYRSYLKLRKESEHHAMSYVEQRKKDRAFGRFVKAAKRDMDR